MIWKILPGQGKRMNIIKKYWDSVYIYVLLIIPCYCACAGIFETICKAAGMYADLSWFQIAAFDVSQLIYLGIAVYFIYRNNKDSSYIPEHLFYVKGFIMVSLFIQYNSILILFPSNHIWACTFAFFAAFVFLFDSKIMLANILIYFASLITVHVTRPDKYLSLGSNNLMEAIAFRLVIFWMVAVCTLLIVYFVEKFLMQAQENREENIHLLEKQLQYYKNIELLDTELRKFRHDIRNHFICMESLLNSGKEDELQDYFKDLQQNFSFRETMYFSGNDVVDAILNYDIPHDCRPEVEVTVYGRLPKLRTVSAMDLCTLFSNLLSNSIRSANQCTDSIDPQIVIHFQTGKKYFTISISNSIRPEDDTIHLTKKRKKHTDRNHGFGLNKIKEVLEKYDGRFEQIAEQQMLTIKVYLPI